MYAKVRELVLKKIRPSTAKQKKALTIAKEQKKWLASLLDADIILGGSMAKGTWLKNNHDIDFFACFSQEMNLVALEKYATKVKGSREYYQYEVDGFQIEVVPVKKIASYKDAKNVTDVSPLHVSYTKSRLSRKQCDDVRLAKQFCKANSVYGAESYINGFSGHVLELLIMYYGGFRKLLQEASSWESPVIDIEGHHKNPLRAINASKHSPLILIDPIQPNRNAAAALSKESFAVFVRAAKEFLTKPTTKAFVKQTLSVPKNAVRIVFTALEGKRDTSGTKCLKAFEYILKNVKEFSVEEYGWEYDHSSRTAEAFILAHHTKLSRTYIHEGPPVRVKDAKKFLAKHKDAYERNNRLYVERKREFCSLEKKIQNLIKESPITSRVESVRIL